VATSATSGSSEPDSLTAMWKRMAYIVVVGVCLAGLAATYLSVRPAHAHASRSGPSVPLSVSCPTAQFCMAVDDQGNAIRFDDGVWSRPRSLQGTGLNLVSCPSPTFCAAVGVNGDAFLLRGASWSTAMSIDPKSDGEADSFGTSGLSTVSCATTTFCMAGDVLGRVSIFDGNRWTRPQRMEPHDLYKEDRKEAMAGISSLSCPQPKFCVALTVAGRALTFDGATWSSPTSLEPAKVVGLDRFLGLSALAAVSCGGPRTCVAVDPAGNAFTFDGSSWATPQSVDPLSAHDGDGDGLTAISCPTAVHCVAVDGRGDALTYDDGSWSAPASVDSTLGLTSISCAARDFCVSLNDLGQVSTYDGHRWTTPKAVER
jgi:hypothetical protein